MPWKNGNPPLYTVWKSMLARCYKASTKQFKDYGGRGIKVCPQWRHDYKQWYADVSPAYRPGLTFDRRDNDNDYTPDNCRWATHKQQQRNQRRTHKIIVEGVEYIAIDLSDQCGLRVSVLLNRIKKHPQVTLKRLLSKNRFGKYRQEPKPKHTPSYNRGGQFCKRGHEYTSKNTGRQANGVRFCKACDALRSKWGSARTIPV